MKCETDKTIYSNIPESLGFYARSYTPCKLVVRSKAKYARNCCEKCKGTLIPEQYTGTFYCPYLKNDIVESKLYKEQTENDEFKYNVLKQTHSNGEEEFVSIVTELKNADKSIDRIEIENKEEQKDTNFKKYTKEDLANFKKKYKQSINFVCYKNSYRVCNICGEFHNKGFEVDGDFLCTDCCKKDFKDFYNRYKDLKVLTIRKGK